MDANIPERFFSPIYSPFPNEIIEMFIDLNRADEKAMKNCSLVHSRWRQRARSHLFAHLVIYPHKHRGIWSFSNVPEKIRNEISPETRNVVKRLTVDAQSMGSAYIDAALACEFLLTFPNVNYFLTKVDRLGRGKPKRPRFHNPTHRRFLDCLEIHGLNWFQYNSYLYDFLFLFSEINTLIINDTTAQFADSESEEEDNDEDDDENLTALPQIHHLVIEDLVADEFIDGLFCNYEPSRLASLQSLDIRLFPKGEAAEFKTIANEVGKWLPKLTLGVYDPLSSLLHSFKDVEDSDLVNEFGNDFWEFLLDWDLCPALEELTIYADICVGSDVENRLPLVTMSMVIILLEYLARSKAACKRTKKPLQLTLELRVMDGYYSDTLVAYCENVPWKRLRAVLLKLQERRTIRLNHVKIKLCGNLGTCLDKEVEDATSALVKGIQQMHLNFVEGPILKLSAVRFPALSGQSVTEL